MPEDSRVVKVLGSVGAAILTVITGVLIFRFNTATSKVPVPPTYPQVAVTGTVSDALTGHPIANAQVLIDADGDVENGYSDSEGRFLFKLAGTSIGPRSVMMDVEANGYQRYKENDLPVNALDLNYLGPNLAPVAPPAVATNAGGSASAAPGAAAADPGTAGNGTAAPVAGAGDASIQRVKVAHAFILQKRPPDFVLPSLTKIVVAPKN